MVRLSKYAGFCPGVKRADIAIRKLIASRTANEKIYTLGTLIHNAMYTDELRALGVVPLKFDEILSVITSEPEINHTLVIRTHGIPKEQNDTLLSYEREYGNFKLVDMTCPSVKKSTKLPRKAPRMIRRSFFSAIKITPRQSAF